jgi:hypothetical protein
VPVALAIVAPARGSDSQTGYLCSVPSRVRRGVILVTVVAAAAVFAAAISFVVWDRYFNEASPASPGMSCPTIVQPTHHPPLAAIGIHRVALIGDSLMDQSSCAVADSLADVGIQTERYAASGSGLLTGQPDWLAAMPHLLAAQHPDVVIAIFVGNYLPPPLHDAKGNVVVDNSPEFFSLWQQRAEKLSNEVRSAGASMYWVSPPPIESPLLNHAQRLFDGYRSIPGDHTLDVGSVLAGAHGQEVLYKLTCGKVQLIRNLIDGVHLTDQGGRLYGEEIAHQFTAQTGLLTSPKPC